MIKERFEALEKFKIFKTEVEKELRKVIKIVRFNRGYGKYGSARQHIGPFALYLQDYGIVPQYTMPMTSKQNGVAKRCNRTLKDMMRSMISRCNLQEFMWGETLKTIIYI